MWPFRRGRVIPTRHKNSLWWCGPSSWSRVSLNFRLSLIFIRFLFTLPFANNQRSRGELKLLCSWGKGAKWMKFLVLPRDKIPLDHWTKQFEGEVVLVVRITMASQLGVVCADDAV
jgi:hypothetical protein